MQIKLEIHFKYALASCLIVLGIVAVVSISWDIGKPEIAGFGARYIPMAPLTAILFGLLSLTTITQIVGSRGAVNRVLCYVFLAVVGTLSVLDLTDFCLGDPFDFEAALLPNPEPFGTVMVGRISPIASACFLIATTASGFLTYFRGNRKSVFNDVISILVSILIFANLVFILGYIYGAPLLYVGRVIPVGLLTAIAFIFLGCAIIFTNGPAHLPLSLFTGATTRAV